MNISVDEELMRDAREMSGIMSDEELVRLALTQMIEREAGRRLAELGGTMPDLKFDARRRRFD